MTDAPAPAKNSTTAALGWAVFLGCSWTWVIGMFLPVLLVRDYGVWAWFVFAIPNVIGAAAMGWTLRDPAHSRDMSTAHRSACSAFSLVTIAFHVFFIAWAIAPWVRPEALLPAVATAGVAYFTLRGGAGARWVALLTYAFSLLSAALFLRGGVTLPVVPGNRWAWHQALLWLAPVCTFGFALNPYLDLTFHAVRQTSESRRSSRIAFGAGFAIFFLAMILFTLTYSGQLWSALTNTFATGEGPASTSRIWFVVGHILFQAGFTVGVHTAVVTARRPVRWWLGWAVAVVIGIVAAIWAQQAGVVRNLFAGEFVYRLFMAFYGLLFPAYAWLCMRPNWRNPRPPTSRALAVWGAVVLLAGPMYWLAFIDGKMLWLLPGLLIVLAGRILVPARSQAPAGA